MTRRLADDAGNSLAAKLGLAGIRVSAGVRTGYLRLQKDESTLLELGKAMCLGASRAYKAQGAAEFLQGLFDRSCKLVRTREAMFMLKLEQFKTSSKIPTLCETRCSSRSQTTVSIMASWILISTCAPACRVAAVLSSGSAARPT